MTIHTCNKCQKTFNQKCNFNRHLSRKIPCKEAVIATVNVPIQTVNVPIATVNVPIQTVPIQTVNINISFSGFSLEEVHNNIIQYLKNNNILKLTVEVKDQVVEDELKDKLKDKLIKTA